MGNDEFVVKIKALTPIWTGDASRRNTTLRETGIVGSLRWWYEALIRGLGGYACDPTSNNRCLLNQNKFKKALKEGKSEQEALSEQICPACQLFGCTGWSRKFRLEAEFSTTIPEIRIGTRERREGKYLKRNVAGFMSDGPTILKFIPLKEITQNEWASLNLILRIIENYGGLGARLSQGNGVIKIVENMLPHRNENPRKLASNNSNSPSLKDFFFYKFRVEFTDEISNLINRKVLWTHASDHRGFSDNWNTWKKLWNDYHFLPIAFHIRDAIRHLESDKNKRHRTFGKLGMASKVFVSHGYKINEKAVEVRIWGYDVEDMIRNGIKSKLQECLKEKLFSQKDYKGYFDNCKLVEGKTGREFLEGLR